MKGWTNAQLDDLTERGARIRSVTPLAPPTEESLDERLEQWRSANDWIKQPSASRQAKDTAKAKKEGIMRKPRKPRTKQAVRQSSKGMNKVEAAFESEVLKPRKERGEIASYLKHDTITLKLANGVRYTPDFPVYLSDQSLAFYEVKGTWGKGVHIEDDAAVKVKVAPALFPQHKFFIVWKEKGGGWQEQEILP